MPIVERAPWRQQYFAECACPDDVNIPTDDPDAWAWNPRHRWVFDKLQVALSQVLEAAPHGLEPPQFPVFSKPIYNFGGMGAGSRILSTREDYLRHLTPGHLWMPLLSGRHVSTDLALVDGSVKWMRHATGLEAGGGTFDFWTIHAAAEPRLDATLAAWARRHLARYTGMLNVESIGGVIIEAHLRFADQWPDLYGRGWVEALVGLYAKGAWVFDDGARREGYSVVLFMPHGPKYWHPPRRLVDEVLSLRGVTSVQIPFHDHEPPEAHSMPPGGFRVAIVNAFDLEAGRQGRDLLHEWFQNC